MIFDGLDIRVSDLAVTRRKVVEVVRHPTRKRRRGWRVKITIMDEPGALIVFGRIYVHPTIFAKLKELPP